MKNKKKSQAFEIGDLASFRGCVMEVLITDEDDRRRWCFLKPFADGVGDWVDWYPESDLEKVVTVNVGFNGDDETQMDPKDAADLRELLEVFFSENGIENPYIDYAESVAEAEE